MSLSADPNDAPWPATGPYAYFVAKTIQRYFHSANGAACTIVRFLRAKRGGHPAAAVAADALPPHHGRRCTERCTYREMRAVLTAGTAAVKLDGTNVGKDTAGKVYGRRYYIGDATETYQNAPLEEVRAANTGAARDRLADELRHSGFAVEAADLLTARVVVYGELMCNRDLYDYERAGLAGGWLAFGVLVQYDTVEQLGEARALVGAARRAGFCATLCNDGRPTPAVQFGGSKLSALLRAAGMRVPTEVAGAGADHGDAPLVLRCASFMEPGVDGKARAEGLVVALPDNGLHKWKDGKEFHPGSGEALQNAMKTQQAHGAETVDVLLGDLGAVVPRMLEILAATGGGMKRKPATKQAKKQAQACKHDLDRAVLAKLFKDATSKLRQHPDQYFSAGERTALIEEIKQEICKDEEKPPGIADKYVSTFVQREVGMLFGEWKERQ